MVVVVVVVVVGVEVVGGIVVAAGPPVGEGGVGLGSPESAAVTPPAGSAGSAGSADEFAASSCEGPVSEVVLGEEQAAAVTARATTIPDSQRPGDAPLWAPAILTPGDRDRPW